MDDLISRAEAVRIISDMHGLCRDDVWAAEHPEPVYPTWGEWLEKQGVVKLVQMPLQEDGASYYALLCEIEAPIPADIAQKLGIEPKEG